MFWYLMDVLAFRKLGLVKPIRFIVFVVLLGCFIAGLIYAVAMFTAVNDRSHDRHVNSHVAN